MWPFKNEKVKTLEVRVQLLLDDNADMHEKFQKQKARDITISADNRNLRGKIRNKDKYILELKAKVKLLEIKRGAVGSVFSLMANSKG